DTMRPNPAFNTSDVITELGVGEALISFLDEKGRPAQVERSFVIAPSSRLGVLSGDERAKAIRESTIYGHYEKVLDRESAYEKLQASAQGSVSSDRATVPAPAPAEAAEQSGGGLLGGLGGSLNDILFGRTGPRGGKTDGLVQAAAKSVARTIGSSVGREIVRGVLGSLLGGRRRK
ncbi:MAG: helicase HerA-like domain-containing protein, partial [Smithellaceae bacterium]